MFECNCVLKIFSISDSEKSYFALLFDMSEWIKVAAKTYKNGLCTKSKVDIPIGVVSEMKQNQTINMLCIFSQHLRGRDEFSFVGTKLPHAKLSSQVFRIREDK